MGTLPPDALFPTAFIDEDHMIAIETDASDVPKIVSYRIDRDPARPQGRPGRVVSSTR